MLISNEVAFIGKVVKILKEREPLSSICSITVGVFHCWVGGGDFRVCFVDAFVYKAIGHACELALFDGFFPRSCLLA